MVLGMRLKIGPLSRESLEITSTQPRTPSSIPRIYRAPAYNFPWNYVYDIHLNWQATKKDKFSGFESFEDRCACFQGVDTANRAPEASDDDWNRATFLTQVTWDREADGKVAISRRRHSGSGSRAC